MLNEIDKDFYCSCDFIQMGDNYEPEHCHGKTNGYCEGCSARHRKWPTPEQFQEEYGVNYPNDGLTWFRWLYDDGWSKWNPGAYKGVKSDRRFIKQIICACTPWGKPPADWRPS